MRRILALVLAAVFILSWAAMAQAAELDLGFELYGQYGFSFHSEEEGTEGGHEITPWALGAVFEMDRFLVGGEYMVRSMEEEDISVESSGAYSVFDSSIWQIYGGYRIVDTKHFDLYGLAGYAAKSWDLFLPGEGYLEMEHEIHGVVAGIGFKAPCGRFVIDGRLLTSIEAQGEWAISFTYDGPYYMTGQYLDAQFTLADLRVTWKITDLLGLYLGYGYSSTSVSMTPERERSGHSTWWFLGASLGF